MELAELERRERIFREAFAALRDMAAHTPGCARCLRMMSGGAMCPVYQKCTEKCREANGILRRTDYLAERTAP